MMDLFLFNYSFPRALTASSIYCESIVNLTPCLKVPKEPLLQAETNLIPGCVGRGFRLGSEKSSGGVWKSGDLEI